MQYEKSAIKAGMRVTLKNGGPPMTVVVVSGDQAYCEWFTGSRSEQGTFALGTLQPQRSEENEAQSGG